MSHAAKTLLLSLMITLPCQCDRDAGGARLSLEVAHRPQWIVRLYAPYPVERVDHATAHPSFLPVEQGTWSWGHSASAGKLSD